ncbi:hypothetical protein MUK42_26445 [Musa troglodytarum]|uniref:Glycosyltransferase 61 catalytic domain-containing protein n=1 Tax=Musa troglodytarum TaxID=320322 RepID=A0A9E7JPT1_9LILI|nr:hypothetical protein MUK42_26445 [Musa troglodytarum]
MNRQQKTKSVVFAAPTQGARPPIIEKERKIYFLHRVLPLLLLMIYAVGSVLRLTLSSPFASSFVQPSASSSFSVEWRKDMEFSLKTQIPAETNHLRAHEEKQHGSPCAALVDGRTEEAAVKIDGLALVCCDRSHVRSDLCYARGDIRTDSPSSSILVYVSGNDTAPPVPAAVERIRPYTRKWETGITNTILEITIRSAHGGRRKVCDVRQEGVPGLVFSNGGYTGNLYHDFSDGLIPLYITAQRFRGEVVLVVAEYHTWWLTRYRLVLERLTNYKLVDFRRDTRVHCFSEMIVGLRIHGELTIDPHLMPNDKSIRDFRTFLREGFGGAVQPTAVPRAQSPSFLRPLQRSSRHDRRQCGNLRPRIAILIRKGCRVLLNRKEVTRACQKTGFDVQIIEPRRGAPLAARHHALASAEVMLAVHGAAMTHFLFMRPASVLIQVVPLGLERPAEEFYGQPARRLGLEYIAYSITPEESSLSKLYDRRSPVIVNTRVVTSKGWLEMKKIYLDRQNVRVNLERFKKVLERAHASVCGPQKIYKPL